MHGIVSIGAVEFEDPNRNFYMEPQLNHEKQVDSGAVEYNGFTEWEMRNTSRPSLNRVLKNFKKWYERCHEISLAGHNIGQFDYGFLRKAFEEAKIDWPFGNGVVDLRTDYIGYCKRNGIHIPIEKKRLKAHLDDILEFVGLTRRPDVKKSKKKHNALEDARATAEAYARLIYGAHLIKEYSECPIPDGFVHLG